MYRKKVLFNKSISNVKKVYDTGVWLANEGLYGEGVLLGLACSLLVRKMESKASLQKGQDGRHDHAYIVIVKHSLC